MAMATTIRRTKEKRQRFGNETMGSIWTIRLQRAMTE